MEVDNYLKQNDEKLCVISIINGNVNKAKCPHCNAKQKRKNRFKLISQWKEQVFPWWYAEKYRYLLECSHCNEKFGVRRKNNERNAYNPR